YPRIAPDSRTRPKQDVRQCGGVLPCHLEEEVGTQLRNPIFHLLLDRLPVATWLDRPDECAVAVCPKPACPLLDRSHICDTIPRIDARRIFQLPPRPNSPYALASAPPLNRPRSAAASLQLACAPQSQGLGPHWPESALLFAVRL